MNDRITKKERGLLKGAFRRVFARSELRQRVLNTADIEHSDPTRPRVKKWSRCPVCKEPRPKYTMVVDHISPFVPINTTFEEMSLDIAIDRMWCEENNLQPICEICHKDKTARERLERKLNKKGSNKDDVKSKTDKRTGKASSKRSTSRGSKRATIRSFKKTRRL